jgi:hypothetical protein
LLERATSYKHCDMQIEKWNNNAKKNTQTRTLSSLTDVPLQFLILRIRSPHSIITNLYIFLSLYHFFPLMAGWWIFHSCRCFLPSWRSQNVRSHFQKYIFMTCKGKGKGLPQQAEVVQGVQGRLRPRICLTFGSTKVVGRQPYALAVFTAGEIPGTHFYRLSRPQGTWFCR